MQGMDKGYTPPTTNFCFLSQSQLVERLERNQADKKALKLGLYHAGRTIDSISRNLDECKRLMLMIAKEDIPGLKRIFSQMLKEGWSTHALLDRLTRAMQGTYSAQKS